MPRDTGTTENPARPARAYSRLRRLAPNRITLAAFCLGAVSVAGFAPLYLYALPILTLATLLLLLRAADSPKRAAAIGWWFGLGFFLFGVSWVYVSLSTFGAMPVPL